MTLETMAPLSVRQAIGPQDQFPIFLTPLISLPLISLPLISLPVVAP